MPVRRKSQAAKKVSWLTHLIVRIFLLSPKGRFGFPISITYHGDDLFSPFGVSTNAFG
jgi:hypothetical protein